MSFDAASYQSKHEKSLRNAQMLLEDAIKTFAMAVDSEAAATEAYRIRKQEALKEAKAEGFPPSSVAEIAKLKAHVEESEMLKATGRKKEAQYWIEAYRDRCTNIRHLARDIEKGLIKEG